MRAWPGPCGWGEWYKKHVSGLQPSLTSSLTRKKKWPIFSQVPATSSAITKGEPLLTSLGLITNPVSGFLSPAHAALDFNRITVIGYPRNGGENQQVYRILSNAF